MTGRPRIVILNGPSSAGKGSIARALQAIARDDYLHVQMDAFIAMMPERSDDQPDGFTFATSYDDGKPLVTITGGALAVRTMRGMRHAIAAMAEQGNNLIVDDVRLDGMDSEYQRLLAPFELFLIGVSAPLDVLEVRELARGDRMIGMARGQHKRVHCGVQYDLTVNTGTSTPAECSDLIRRRFEL